MNTINQTPTPISKDEQVVAIKNIAEEYNSVTSMTTTVTHVIVVMDDTCEAGELVTRLRNLGWWSATNGSGQLSSKWFVRVPLNT